MNNRHYKSAGRLWSDNKYVDVKYKSAGHPWPDNNYTDVKHRSAGHPWPDTDAEHTVMLKWFLSFVKVEQPQSVLKMLFCTDNTQQIFGWKM